MRTGIRMFYIDPAYFQIWEYEDVTLATQCSANHLHHVIMLTERWSGKVFKYDQIMWFPVQADWTDRLGR